MTISDNDSNGAASTCASGAECGATCAPQAEARTGAPERVDRAGVFASSLCAVHCVVAAALPAALGGLGFGFLLGHEAEWAFTAVAVAFASAALVLGWRHHRSPVVAALLVLGIVGLLASRAIELGSSHGDHHDEPHVEAALSGVTASEPVGHMDGGADAHAEVREELTGVTVGVVAGLLLLAGHVLNFRERRIREGRAS